MRVLVVDSDTAEINSRKHATFGQTTGEGYADALLAINPDLKVTIVTPYVYGTLPDLSAFDGAAFTGSAVDWCTDAAEAKPLAHVMDACFEAGIPVVGSCNGMQLAATVLGGSNRASPNGREDGLALKIELTETGRSHSFLAGRRDGYAVPCVHRDEVDRLPQGAELLASNAHSKVQAFAYDRGGVRFWGVQYHPEYTLPFTAVLMQARNRVSEAVARDIERAADSAKAASRLGVRVEDMQQKMRTCELRNWIDSL